MSGWEIRTIGSVCHRVTSGGTPSRANPNFYTDGTIPWIKTGELKGWYLDTAEEWITEEAIEKSSAKIFPPETILMAMYGQGSTITSVAILRRSASTNQACCAMIVNKDICHPYYLLYSLKSHKEQLLNLALGASQRNLSVTTISNFTIPLPPLETQRRIAAILSAYDDLIENNTHRIQALEQAAHDLYREWFVEFRFPGHESVPLVDSGTDYGMIPQGWEIAIINDLIQRHKVPYKYNQNEAIEKGIVPIIDQSRDVVLGYHNHSPDFVASVEHPIIIFGDHTCKMKLMTIPFSLAENVIPFEGKKLPAVFILHLVSNLIETREYKRHWTDLIGKAVVVPNDDKIINAFVDFIRPNYSQLEVLSQKNNVLREARDLLLPRLVSGELDVSEIEVEVSL